MLAIFYRFYFQTSTQKQASAMFGLLMLQGYTLLLRHAHHTEAPYSTFALWLGSRVSDKMAKTEVFP